MLSGIKSWFTALSAGGKIAVVAGSIIGAGAIANAVPTSPQTPPQEQHQPVVETKTLSESQSIACKVKRTKDSTLAKGKTKTIQHCKNGKKKVKFEITLTDGIETSRSKVSEQVTIKPVDKILAIGTYVPPPPPPPSCDSNYSGCVPIASDVDCSGGSGNGPAYVAGPVYVTGYDIYGLDFDGDGVGCE